MPIFKKSFIIFHHSLTPRDRTTFSAVNNYHQEKFNFLSEIGFYIGYHYFIDAAGKIYQGRKDEEAGAHCKEADKNFDSIGICMAGNFDIELPSPAQLGSLKKLTAELMGKHGIPLNKLKFHRDYAKYKTCPGKNIKKDFRVKLLQG